MNIDVIDIVARKMNAPNVERAQNGITKMRWRIAKYIFKRALSYLIILFVSITIFFWILRLIPGDPIQRQLEMLVQRYQVQRGVPTGVIERYRETLALDKDLLTQYLHWLTGCVLKFSFGPSVLDFPSPAENLIMRALPWSIGLLSIAALLSWAIGIIVGTLAGWKSHSKIDTIIVNYALFISRIPFYLLAIVLLLVFGYMLALFPTRGAYSLSLTPSLTLEFIFDVIHHAFLPALSIIIVDSCGWILSSRALAITICGEDYLLLAEAKGLRKSRILLRYILRNSLLPQVTGLAMSLGGTVSGFFLVEWIFGYPGIGQLFVTAVQILDYNLIQGITLISIITVLGANFIVDLIYPLIDPRIKYEE